MGERRAEKESDSNTQLRRPLARLKNSNRYMKNILLLCSVLVILIGCKKEQVPAAHSKQVVVPCSESNKWTKESLDKALQGNWLLIRVETAKGQQDLPYQEISFWEGHLLVFDMPHSGAAHSEYVVEQTSDLLSIRADSNVANAVNGYLYLCGDYLICSGIAFDGADRYYKRN